MSKNMPATNQNRTGSGRFRTSAQHPFRRFNKMLQGGEFPHLFVLSGREQYLIQWAVQELRSRLVEPAAEGFDYVRLNGQKMGISELIENCETLPLSSARRMVVVDDFDLLSGAGAASEAKAAKATETETGTEAEATLIQYMGNIPESCLLVFVQTTIDRRRRLYKAIAAAGDSYDFIALREDDLAAFIRKYLSQNGRQAAEGTIKRWIAHSGYLDKVSDYTLFHFANDIEKLISYTDKPEISFSDILAVTSTNLETYVFTMLDEIAAGRPANALRLLSRLLRAGENEYRLLHLLASQLELVLMVREMQEQRVSANEMAERLGVQEFRIRKAAAWARSGSIAKFRLWFRRCCQIDRQIKTGRLGARLALELLIGTVTAKAETGSGSRS
jgi:DNA polymerase-3 subunit delta